MTTTSEGTAKRRRFTAGYKEQAVARLAEPGATVTGGSQGGRCDSSQLKGWQLEITAAGSAKAMARQKAEELQQLRRDNRRLKEEHKILGKASAFFAQWAGKA